MGNQKATANDGITWVRELCAALQIPRLGVYGINRGDVPALCEKAALASSTKGNPLALTGEEMQQILALAI